MSQSQHEIESDINHRRADLHSNLQELEGKVKSVTDWREVFANHPGAMTAAAFGAGALLATMLGRTNRPQVAMHATAHERAAHNDDGALSQQRGPAAQSWGNIKNAVAGLAATKLTGYLADLMPGFEGELRKVSPRNDSSSPADNSQRPSI